MTPGMMSELAASRWRPLFFDERRGGWAELDAGTTLPVGLLTGDEVLDIAMEDASHSAYWQAAHQPELEEGYFGVGVVSGKTAENAGTVWRSAYQLGAAFTFTIGARFTLSKLDTASCWQSVPMLNFPDAESFSRSAPFGAQWVVVEMGGEPLSTFVHPRRAVYILGGEADGTPAAILKAAHHRVTIPCVRSESFNVAVAASIVLYDRLAKANGAPNQTWTLPPAPPRARPLTTSLPDMPHASSSSSSIAAPAGSLANVIGAASGVPCAVSAQRKVRPARSPAAPVAPLCAIGRLSQPVLLLRCRAPLKQRVVGYVEEEYRQRLVRDMTEGAVLAFGPLAIDADDDGGAGGGGSLSGARDDHVAAAAVAAAATLCVQLRRDENLARALEGYYVATHAAGSLAQLASELVRRVDEAQSAAAADRVVLRLNVHPRATLLSPLQEVLQPIAELSPTRYTHVLSVLERKPPGRCPGTSSDSVYLYAVVAASAYADESASLGRQGAPGGSSALAEAVRRAALPTPSTARLLLVQEKWKRSSGNSAFAASMGTVVRVEPEGAALPNAINDEGQAEAEAKLLAEGVPFTGCVIDLNLDAERLIPWLTQWAPRVLQPGSWVIATLQLRSRGASAREEAVKRMIEKLVGGAGCAARENIEVVWLLADGPFESTLICRSFMT
jgi:tRNA(Leu) C34 or U34 (ribose-2'-O)-methylase TrmL